MIWESIGTALTESNGNLGNHLIIIDNIEHKMNSARADNSVLNNEFQNNFVEFLVILLFLFSFSFSFLVSQKCVYK